MDTGKGKKANMRYDEGMEIGLGKALEAAIKSSMTRTKAIGRRTHTGPAGDEGLKHRKGRHWVIQDLGLIRTISKRVPRCRYLLGRSAADNGALGDLRKPHEKSASEGVRCYTISYRLSSHVDFLLLCTRACS